MELPKHAKVVCTVLIILPSVHCQEILKFYKMLVKKKVIIIQSQCI